MEKKMKMVMLLAAAAFIGGIAWVVFSVPKEENVKEAGDPGPRLMEYSSNTIREEKDGKVIWEIYAEQSQMNVDTQDTVFQNIIREISLSLLQRPMASTTARHAMCGWTAEQRP